MTRPLLSIGGVGVDAVVRADALPPEALRPERGGVRMFPGGKAANVAVAAKRLGARPILVAQLGDDVLSDIALATLGAEDVELSVERVRGCATSFAALGISGEKKRTYVFAPGATNAWDERARSRALAAVDRAAVLVLSLEIPRELVRALAARARERAVPVIVDPSPADALDDLVADTILPNADEASELSDVDVTDARTAAVAAQRLRARGHRVVVVKLSGGGCVAVAADELHVVEPPLVDAVDTNGAGDAFAAAFAVARLEDRTLRDAAVFAVATSTLAVTRESAQASMPCRADVDAFARRVRIRDLRDG